MLIYVSWRCCVFLCRGRYGKNTLASVVEKFDKTHFNFVKMSIKFVCKVLTVIYNLIKCAIIYQLFKIIQCFLKFLPQLIIQSQKPRDHRACQQLKCQKNIQQIISNCYIFFLSKSFLTQISRNVRNRFLTKEFLPMCAVANLYEVESGEGEKSASRKVSCGCMMQRATAK